MIQIRLLGPFEARREDGVPIRAPGRRSLALMACLALEQAGWQRARLAALLWHGRAPEQARASLRQELSRLRGTFGPLLEVRPDDPLAVPRLVSGMVDLDVSRFRAAACESGRAMEAVALYRGPLLQDFPASEDEPFHKWLIQWREELHSLAIDSFRRLLASPEASEPIARRVSELAPDCEEAHLWLIRHHAERGEMSRALESYHTSERALHAVGREPGTAIRGELARLIQFHRPNDRKAARRAETTEWIRAVRRSGDVSGIPGVRQLAPITDRPSIVVLPFTDMSLDGAHLIFVDGLTEEVTNALARVPGFFVTARHSAMAYRNAAVDVRQIASELGVRYVVEGSMERRANRIRINARVIEGATGLHLWADTQEHNAHDPLAARDEIVRAITARLQPSLRASEIRLALRRPTEDLDAWGWMQRAQGALMSMRRQHGLEAAIEPLLRALQADPHYAMAHALLSAVHTWRTLSYSFPDPARERAQAREHAKTAWKSSRTTHSSW